MVPVEVKVFHPVINLARGSRLNPSSTGWMDISTESPRNTGR
jgi:hypothetical protein